MESCRAQLLSSAGVMPMTCKLQQKCPINAHLAHFGPFLAHFQAYLGHMPDFASQGESPWFGPARDLANFGGAVKICPAYAWARKLPRDPPRHASGIFRAYASGAKTSPRPPAARLRHIPGICLRGQNFPRPPSARLRHMPALIGHFWAFVGHIWGILYAFRHLSGICLPLFQAYARHMPGAKDLEPNCERACFIHVHKK